MNFFNSIRTRQETQLFLKENSQEIHEKIQDTIQLSQILAQYIASTHHEWQKTVFLNNLLKHNHITGLRSLNLTRFSLSADISQMDFFTDSGAIVWTLNTSPLPGSPERALEQHRSEQSKEPPVS
ncbi:MAG: hypothetical protein QM498_09715 [Desulfobacterium sp.]